MSKQGGVFWHRPEVQEAISRLSHDDRLTILTGAGVSAEVGFPLWGQLVRRLVESAAAADSRLRGNDAERAAFAERVMSEGVIAAASYAHALLGDRLDNVLADCLYREVLAPSIPSPSAMAVARLYAALGDAAELVTLNYDDQLPLAFDQLGLRGAKALRSGRSRRSGEALVRHLHGQVPIKGSVEGLVLTEADYYDANGRPPWQEKFMRTRLAGGSMLFVGTSLGDPNLLRYLYSQKAPSPLKHTAIFTIDPADPIASSTAYADASLKKWREVGVDPLRNDMYGQTAQFLHEVRLARQLGGSYRPYADRLRDWSEGMKGWLHSADPREFARNQSTIQEQLAAAVSTVTTLVSEHGVRLAPGEQLGIHLWSRIVDTRELVLLGGSAMRWTTPEFMPAVSLRGTSAGHPAVRAFTQGARMIFDLGSHEAPWRTTLALPIALEEHPRFGRLPVGVVALSSTCAGADSVLRKLRAEVPDADEFLAGDGGPGQDLLDPESALSGS